MTGAEYDPNDEQPNNPNIFDWIATLLCPYNLDQCGTERLGLHGDEWYAMTSSRRGFSADNVETRVYRVLYDAANGHKATHEWHDLAQEEWRAI